jgi:AraC-like DNA-binding protein
VDLVRHFLGPSWLPSEIGLEATDVSILLQKRFPGSRIVAQQKTSYITVPRSCLHRAPRFGKIQLEKTDTEVLGKRFDYIDTLRVLLSPYLRQGYPSEHFAAELMNTTVRTLTRRLSKQNLTYGTLIDDLRFQLAKDYLQNPDMRLLDIALAIGFSDQGNFTRMFRRIGGLTPGEYRRQLKADS